MQERHDNTAILGRRQEERTMQDFPMFLHVCHVMLDGALSSWLNEKDQEVIHSPFAEKCQLRDFSGCIHLNDEDVGILIQCYQQNDPEKFKEHMREKLDLNDSFDWERYQRLKMGKEWSKHRPQIPAWLVLKVFRRDKFRCVICGSNEDLQVDHICPVIEGGKDNDENLQTLCKRCNLKKGAIYG